MGKIVWFLLELGMFLLAGMLVRQSNGHGWVAFAGLISAELSGRMALARWSRR